MGSTVIKTAQQVKQRAGKIDIYTIMVFGLADYYAIQLQDAECFLPENRWVIAMNQVINKARVMMPKLPESKIDDLRSWWSRCIKINIW
jgi:hypothetical protein